MGTPYGASKLDVTEFYLGRVLVGSEHETISTDEMMKEFEIELPDDYVARVLAHRHTPGNME